MNLSTLFRQSRNCISSSRGPGLKNRLYLFLVGLARPARGLGYEMSGAAEVLPRTRNHPGRERTGIPVAVDKFVKIIILLTGFVNLAGSLKDLLAIQEQGDRPVIDEAHVHHLAKAAGGHLQAIAGHGLDQVLIELLRGLRGGRGIKGGTPPLAAIPQDGELGYQEDLGLQVQERKMLRRPSPAKTRRCASFCARKATSSGPSAAATPTRISRPAPILATSSSSTRTQASCTRSTTARMPYPCAGNYQDNRSPEVGRRTAPQGGPSPSVASRHLAARCLQAGHSMRPLAHP